MTSSTTLSQRRAVQTWLSKAAFLALVLAIAACGPLVSIQQAQHIDLNPQSLSDTQAGLNLDDVGRTVLGVVVGLLGVGGAVCSLAIMADSFGVYWALQETLIGGGILLLGLAVVGLGGWILYRAWFR